MNWEYFMIKNYIKTIYMKANEMQALVDELSFYSKIDNDTRFYKK